MEGYRSNEKRKKDESSKASQSWPRSDRLTVASDVKKNQNQNKRIEETRRYKQF